MIMLFHRAIPFLVFFTLVMIFALIIIVPVAMAQDDGTTINTGPAIDAVLPFLQALVYASVMALLTVASSWLYQRTGVAIFDRQNAARSVIDMVVKNALSRVMVGVGDWAHANRNVSVKNDILRQVGDYVVLAIPGELKKVGLPPDRDDPRLQQKIEAELAKLVLAGQSSAAKQQ